MEGAQDSERTLCALKVISDVLHRYDFFHDSQSSYVGLRTFLDSQHLCNQAQGCICSKNTSYYFNK